MSFINAAAIVMFSLLRRFIECGREGRVYYVLSKVSRYSVTAWWNDTVENLIQLLSNNSTDIEHFPSQIVPSALLTTKTVNVTSDSKLKESRQPKSEKGERQKAKSINKQGKGHTRYTNRTEQQAR